MRCFFFRSKMVISPCLHFYAMTRGKNGSRPTDEKSLRCFDNSVRGLVVGSAVWKFWAWEIDSFASAARYVTRLCAGYWFCLRAEENDCLPRRIFFSWCRCGLTWKNGNMFAFEFFCRDGYVGVSEISREILTLF